MALKKPSDFFNEKSTFDEVQEQLFETEPEKIESLTEAFQVFKTNLNNIQTLSDFSSAVSGFKENFEKVDLLSKEIEVLKESVSDTLKKEDLNEAMMSHLLFVEKSIDDVQKKIKGLNSKTLHNIKEEFEELQETVIEFINLEVPAYKKQILECERRIDNRFISFKNDINKNIEQIDEDLASKISSISSINENYLDEFRSEVSILDDKVNHLIEDELPRYKKFFAETELKAEEKIESVTELVQSKINGLENTYQNDIQNLNLLVKEFIDQEIPKYKNLITESKIKIEEDFVELEEAIQVKIQEIDESVNLLIKDIDSQNQENNSKVANNLLELQQIVEDSKNQINSISNTYENLYKDFRRREISENEKLESYQKLLDNFSEKISILENNFNDGICSLQENLDISTSKYYDVLKKEVGYFEENISNKVKDLEVNIVVNEKHIKDIQNSVYEVLDNLKLDLIEEKNKELTDKISHIEVILEKFNEKSILNEGLLNEPPNVKNSDPLTPLDQNYVTLKDLQDHYRLFINRVQQQLATIGGGGAVRLDDLDDVDLTGLSNGNTIVWNETSRKWQPGSGGGGGGGASGIGLTISDTAPVDTATYPLWYDSSIGRGFVYYNDGTSSQWVEFNPSGGSGSSSVTLDQVLGYGNTSSFGMSVGVITATSFSGNATSATIAGVSTSVIGGIGSITQLRVSGISTLGVTTFTGNVSFGTSAFFGTDDRLILGNSSDLQLYYNSVNSIISASAGLIVSGGSITYSSDSHSIQNAATTRTFANFSPSGAAFYQNNNTKLEITSAGITVTGTTSTNNLSVSGVTTSTGGFVGSLTGNATSATYATTSGIATYATTAGVSTTSGYSTTSGIATYATTAGIATYATTSGVSTSVSGGTASVTQIQVTGVSTFTNGPVLIGSGTSTGTASQRLQVTGGGYFSGNVGIGTTISPENGLAVYPKLQILNDASANGRIILRAKPGNLYRWNIDNDGSTNNLRFFREDDATAANGTVPLSITPTGNATLSGNLNAAGNYYVKLARTSNQTITSLSDTLIGFSAMSDPNSWFNSGNNRITPNVAGNYYISAMVKWEAGASADAVQTNIQIRKTGTTVALSVLGTQTHAYTMNVSAIVTLNGSTDYIELTAYTGNPTSQVIGGDAGGTLTKLELFKLN